VVLDVVVGEPLQLVLVVLARLDAVDLGLNGGGSTMRQLRTVGNLR
jgi:hypothetical protein